MSSIENLPLDHLGILGRSVDDLAATYRSIGFRVVGPAELVAQEPDGTSRSLGQRSAHVMFADTYIELTSVSRPGPGHHLAHFLDSAFGLRLLIFASRDIGDTRKRLLAAGLQPTDVRVAKRQIDYGETGIAEFAWFGLPREDFRHGLAGYVQHRTPELVFQAAVARHANTAAGLSRLVVADAEVAAALDALTGTSGIPLECWSAKRYTAVFGEGPENAAMGAAIGIRTRDLATVGDILDANGVDYTRHAHCIGVSPSRAGGAGLLFDADRARDPHR